MGSIFSKIISREIPGHIVAEDEHYIAFLDINPLAEGHTLVVPKVEIDYMFDLEDETLSKLMVFAKMVSKKIEKVIDCNRIGVAVIGLEVPHAHVHLVPINHVGDIDFSKPKLNLPEDSFSKIAEAIRKA